MASQAETEVTYVDPFDASTWPDYDPATDEAKLIEHGKHAGREWLEGEHVPGTDELLMDFEKDQHIVLPERAGPALDKVRRVVRKAFNEGRKEVEPS